MTDRCVIDLPPVSDYLARTLLDVYGSYSVRYLYDKRYFFTLEPTSRGVRVVLAYKEPGYEALYRDLGAGVYSSSELLNTLSYVRDRGLIVTWEPDPADLRSQLTCRLGLASVDAIFEVGHAESD